MRRLRFSFLAFLLVLFADAYDPAELAKAIEPYLDPATLFVAHADMTRADIAPIAAKMKESIPKLGSPQEQAERLAEFDKAIDIGRKWIADFTQAGGRDFFTVISMSGFPDSPIYAVVPLKKGADSQAIIKLLNMNDSSKLGIHAEVRGDAVIWGSQRMLDSVKTLKPQAQPDLAKAFEAAGDSAVQILFVPSADTRKVLIELAPAPPPGPFEGAKDSITRGMLWMAIGVRTAPDLTMNLVVQSPDAASATTLADTLNKLIDTAKQMIKQELAHAPAEIVRIIGDVDTLAKGFTPAVAGDRLTIHLDADQSLKLAAVVLPAIAKARTQASTSVSMSNMKQILLGCIMYAEDHKGEFPPDFKALMKAQPVLAPQVFKNPQTPDKEVGYVYLRPPKAAPFNQVVVYEAWDNPPARLAVGFADGHVEMMEPAQFEKALEQSKARAAAKP
jgi:hypothetical protein